jgi:cysteine desulfuration protein SufE
MNISKTSIVQRQKDIIEEFAEIEDWRDKYRAIIEYSAELSPYPEELKLDKYLIRECQNKAWLTAAFVDNRVFYYADSEAILVKGLISLLVKIYSVASPQEILDTPADFINKLGLGESLSQNRVNGLSGFVARIKQYALSFQLESHHAQVPPFLERMIRDSQKSVKSKILKIEQ